MQTTIRWKGREYVSRESCLITVGDEGVKVDSTIKGSYCDQIYHVKYTISANSAWEVLSFSVESQISSKKHQVTLQSDGKGNWKTGEGLPLKQFNGCIDIDIPLTPFTNTLPIRRLNLSIGEATEIQVLYLDLLNEETKPVRQKYTRVSQTEYLYENIPNDFEALITVDSDGLVVDYPGLFEREAKRRS